MDNKEEVKTTETKTVDTGKKNPFRAVNVEDKTKLTIKNIKETINIKLTSTINNLNIPKINDTIGDKKAKGRCS